MADILIGLMQDFLAQAIFSGISHHPKVDEPYFYELPAPLLSSGSPEEDRVDTCFLGDEFQALVTDTQV